MYVSKNGEISKNPPQSDRLSISKPVSIH